MVTQVEIFQWISNNLFIVGLGIFFILTWFSIWIGKIFAKLGKKVAIKLRKMKTIKNPQEIKPNLQIVVSHKNRNFSFHNASDSKPVVSPVEEEGYLDLTK